MKAYFFAGILAAIAFTSVSCSGKYNNAIADYVATTQMAKDVKVKEANEVKKITVGDSINYLNQKAALVLKNETEAAEGELAKLQKDLVALGTKARVITDAYAVQLAKVQQTIDSLKAVKPEPTKLYDGRKTDEVIAVVVEAKYIGKGGAEEVNNFVLSPNGKICYGLTYNPDLNPEK